MSNYVFELSGINKRVLQDITLNVEKGERMMVFGPSGSGKSTLLHLFNRLEDPESGTIIYQGKPIEDYEIPVLRKNVGLVLQQPYLFSETVKDNLKYGPTMFNELDEAFIEQLLDYVNLPNSYLDKPVEELSGGEQQRVSLARTLANKPKVLLLDEPTSALDDQNIESIEEDLLNLMEAWELTIIMVTHNLKQAMRLGTHGIYLEEGKVLETGKLPELISNPETEALKNFTTNQ